MAPAAAAQSPFSPRPRPSRVPSEALEGRGPGHPGFLQARPVAGLQREGRAVHGSAVEVTLRVRIAAMPHPAAAPDDATPRVRRERSRGWRRRERRRRRLVLGRLRLVHEEVVLLPELVAAVVLVAPQMLGSRQFIAAAAAAAAGRRFCQVGAVLFSFHALRVGAGLKKRHRC